eukprot:5524307-Pyramimonas_sp.AAC.1
MRPRPRASRCPRTPAPPGGPCRSSDEQTQLSSGAGLWAADVLPCHHRPQDNQVLAHHPALGLRVVAR